MGTTFKSRKTEITDDRNLNRFASYVRLNNTDATKLLEAFNSKDHDEMFNILRANSVFDVNENLMEVYLGLVEELTKKVLDVNSNLLGKEGEKQAKLGEFKPVIKPPKRIKPRKVKQITQTSARQGTYKRGKPKKFSKAETTYLRNNLDLNNRILTTQFNKLFQPRTKSSLVTKKYRLTKKKKVKKKKNEI